MKKCLAEDLIKLEVAPLRCSQILEIHYISKVSFELDALVFPAGLFHGQVAHNKFNFLSILNPGIYNLKLKRSKSRI